QGGFGALVTAAAFGSVLALSTGPQQRRTAFAVWGAAAVGGPVLGLALDLPWRTALYVSCPWR
ncbi:MFS transporter, partial [Streptomyces sp. KHY 26]